MLASSASGRAPARCSGTSSRAPCCGRWAAEAADQVEPSGMRILSAPGWWRSFPLPHRLALLGEGARTFLQILGADDLLHGIQAVVQLEGRVLGHHFGVAQQLLDGREQQRRALGELLRHTEM